MVNMWAATRVLLCYSVLIGVQSKDRASWPLQPVPGLQRWARVLTAYPGWQTVSQGHHCHLEKVMGRGDAFSDPAPKALILFTAKCHSGEE